MQLAGVQRQATEVTRGFAQSLVMGLDTRTVERSQRNLQEALTALRAEMQQLDTTTTKGAQAYAFNANSARRLEQQLRDLGSAYRHVGDMAVQAATAEQNAANARIRNNYLNRSAVIAQEQAGARGGSFQVVEGSGSEADFFAPTCRVVAVGKIRSCLCFKNLSGSSR